MSRRAHSVVLTVLVSVLLAAGAVKNHFSPTVGAESQRASGLRSPFIGGTLRFPLPCFPPSLDPVRTREVCAAIIVNQTYERLIEFDQVMLIQPGLAESWTVSPDGRIYFFHLREAARFHDGQPLTARDVESTIRRILRSQPRTGLHEYLLSLSGADRYASGESEELPGVVVRGDHAVELLLDVPCAPLLYALGLPQASVARETRDGLVGSGPYTVNQISSELIALTALPDRLGVDVFIERLEFPIYSGSNLDKAVTDFLQDRLDVIPIPGAVRKRVEHLTDLKYQQRQSASLFYYGFLMNSAVVGDQNTRRELSAAIDKERLVFEVYGDSHRPAESVTPMGMPSTVTYLAPTSAEATDKRVSHSQIIRIATDGKSSVTTAEIELVKNAWERIGYDVHVTYYPTWPTFIESLRVGAADVYRMEYYPSMPDPDGVFGPLFSSSGASNFMNFRDEEVEDLLTQARQETTLSSRLDAYARIEAIVKEKAPIIPIFHRRIDYAVKPHVFGLFISPLGFHMTNFKSAWIDPS